MIPTEAYIIVKRAYDWLSVDIRKRFTREPFLAIDNGGRITLPDDPAAARFSLYGRIALEAGFSVYDHHEGERVTEAYELAHGILYDVGADLDYLQKLHGQEAPLAYIWSVIEDRYRVTELLMAGDDE